MSSRPGGAIHLDIGSTPIKWMDIARSSIQQRQSAKLAQHLNLFAPISVWTIGHWALPAIRFADESPPFW
jgi:hypothetical protein